MTPRSHRNGGIQSEWKPPLSVFGPHAKVSSSQRGGSDSCRLHILPHIRMAYIQVVCPFPSSTLGFYLVFSGSVAYQPRSTGHDLPLRQQRERETTRWAGWQLYSADAETFRAVPRYQRDSSFYFLIHQPFSQRA